MARYDLQEPRLWADFNGYFGDILCLSHSNTCKADDGTEVTLEEGMIVTAYDEDSNDEGERDDLIATGVVEPSPESLSCRGSVWCLRIDENGLRSESDIPGNQRSRIGSRGVVSSPVPHHPAYGSVQGGSNQTRASGP